MVNGSCNCPVEGGRVLLYENPPPPPVGGSKAKKSLCT